VHGSSRSGVAFFAGRDILSIDLFTCIISITVTMSIMLPFGGTSAGGAWDDRELVNAYDTAMEEFHVRIVPQFCYCDES
jgi:hypothetical protein